MLRHHIVTSLADKTMLHHNRKNKALKMITGLCLLLAVSLTPAKAKAETPSVIFQSMHSVSMLAAELGGTRTNVLKTHQSITSYYPIEHIMWNVGSPWADKFLGTDGFLMTELLEELISIIAWVSQK